MKRLLDFIMVWLALPLLLPLLIVLFLEVKLTTPGPAFFAQYRVGRQRRLFKVYKFRTMVDKAERLGSSVTVRHDRRITVAGRILRRTKLDELPQLFNVFKGEMSLVGPRPDVPEIVRTYSPEMKRIFRIRPGVTSLATLHLKDEEAILASVPDPDRFYEKVLVPLKVRLAMEHVKRNSFGFDLKVLCQTIWMLTVGRWWPIREHSAVNELREAASRSWKDGLLEKSAAGGLEHER